MINEVLTNFKEEKIDENPFSHKVIKNIFPDFFYEELIENLPNIDQYTPIFKTGRVSSNYPPERFVFDLNNETVAKLSKKQQNVFHKIIRLFTDPSFFNVIANEFKNTISQRILEFSEEEKRKFGTSNFKFRISSMLVKDITKYKLGVHTDTPSKFLTFLFYIPKDNKLKSLGTSLYEPKDKDFFQSNNSKGHYPLEHFNFVKKVDFLPNTLFVFPRTNISYHGVDTINIDSAERNLLLLNYYFRDVK